MIKIQQLCSRLVDMIGEETLYHELEGILRKHHGIARRTRKPGRVALCFSVIQDQLAKGICVNPQMIARIVVQYHLSPASIYRLVQALHRQGLELHAVDILREQEKMKAGVY
jgi:hypothetical protein